MTDLPIPPPGFSPNWPPKYPGRLRVVRHKQNAGKGAAIRTGLQEAAGEFGIIQDADLEYDPAEYPKVLAPLVATKRTWSTDRAS